MPATNTAPVCLLQHAAAIVTRMSSIIRTTLRLNAFAGYKDKVLCQTLPLAFDIWRQVFRFAELGPLRSRSNPNMRSMTSKASPNTLRYVRSTSCSSQTLCSTNCCKDCSVSPC